MDTTNLDKIAVYASPVLSIIIFLLGYIWQNKIKDLHEWLLKHESEIRETKQYINEELKEMNKHLYNAEIKRSDTLNDVKGDLRQMKSDIDNIKVICDVRHNR